MQGRYTEAEPLYEQCQAIEEKVLGPEHPSLAATLHNRAGLYEAQGMYKEAIAGVERALAIRRKSLGENHEDTIATKRRLHDLRKAKLR
ncbi:unnamed protein product [Sphacelaria rigidula]